MKNSKHNHILSFWENFIESRNKNPDKDLVIETEFDSLEELSNSLKFLAIKKSWDIERVNLEVNHEKSHAKIFIENSIPVKFSLVLKYINKITSWSIKNSVRVNDNYPNLKQIYAKALINPLKDNGFLSRQDLEALEEHSRYLNKKNINFIRTI